MVQHFNVHVFGFLIYIGKCLAYQWSFFFLINFLNLIFGCIGSSLLHVGFLQLGQAGATLSSGTWASHCAGFSCCGAQALGMRASVVVARRLQSAGSVVVAHRLSCSAACGIFPDQGSNPCPLHWQVDSYVLRYQGSPSQWSLMKSTLVFRLQPINQTAKQLKLAYGAGTV